MPTSVVHVRDFPPDKVVYIGRGNGRYRLKGSPFANPFVINRDGTREECISEYRAWLLERPALVDLARKMLKG